MTTAAFNPKETTHSSAGDVSDDLAALRADIARLADSIGQLAANELGTTVDEIQAKAGAQVTAAERAIRRNPTQAALIAAGVGFLAGLIMIR